MNKLIIEVQELLKNAHFDWCIGGGWAFDLFCGKQTRKHSDVDICAFKENQADVIELMKKPGWTLYYYCGGGIVHLNAGHHEEKYSGKSLCCVKDGNKFFHFIPLGDDMFRQEFHQADQVELDFIDFVFNKRSGGYFLYGHNEDIKRDLGNAVLDYHGIPYLAPEIALLYDSREHDDSEHDFVIATARMTDDQKTWLLNSLNTCYPEGHPWIDRLQRS